MDAYQNGPRLSPRHYAKSALSPKFTRERAAQARLVDAASQSYHLADVRYRAGTDTFLNALTSQRTLYAARQNQIGVALIDVANRIALYQAIGSDHTL